MQSSVVADTSKTQTSIRARERKPGQSKQSRAWVQKKKERGEWMLGGVGGGGFLPPSHLARSEASLGKPPRTWASYCQVCSVPTVCLGLELAFVPAQAGPRSRGYTNISRHSSMSAPHQPLPWCCCIKDESLTLFGRKWFAVTSTLPSLLPACCCLLTMKPLLSLSVTAPLISPVSPTHFSCLCHSLHHTLESSLPHSTAILLVFFFFFPSWSHDGLHETQCHDYTDTDDDERWRFLSVTSVLNKYCVDKPCTFSPPFLCFFFFFFQMLLVCRFGVT